MHLAIFKLTRLRCYLLYLGFIAAVCVPGLTDVEIRNAQLPRFPYRLRSGRDARILIQTPFRTRDPYIDYANQLGARIPVLAQRDPLSLFMDGLKGDQDDKAAIEAAVSGWQSVVSELPSEDGAWENLARLYAALGERSLAEVAAARALSLVPTDYSHLVTAGLLSEAYGFQRESISYYTRAVAGEPRILLSAFWRDFSSRQPLAAHLVIQAAIADRRRNYESLHDPMYGVELSRLLLLDGQVESAATVIQPILSEMPNLEAAWEIGGEIDDAKMNDAAELAYARAAFLDFYDPFPYERIAARSIAKANCNGAADAALRAWSLYSIGLTPHAIAVKARYRLPYSIADTDVPWSWSYYISPSFDFEPIFLQLSAWYEAKGAHEKAIEFRELATRARWLQRVS